MDAGLFYRDLLLCVGDMDKGNGCVSARIEEKTLVVSLPLLLLFLLQTGSHSLLNYDIICLVGKQTTI